MKHFHHFASSLIRYSVPTVSHNFPYSTRLVPHPVQCAPSTKCFIQISQLHPIQFHLLFRTSSAPCCCCLPAPLMLCMINGIKDFDHVDNFYVSWISKKRARWQRRIPVLLSRKRNLRALQKRILMLFALLWKLQKASAATTEFSVVHKSDANGVKIFPFRFE